MLRTPTQLAPLALVLAASGLCFQTAVAQQGADDTIEEIVTTGSRSARPRSARTHPYPSTSSVPMISKRWATRRI